MQRVAALPDEAVNKGKMEFPGTYNRFGKVTESDVQHVERHDEEEPRGNSEDETPGREDHLRLLADEHPQFAALGKPGQD